MIRLPHELSLTGRSSVQFWTWTVAVLSLAVCLAITALHYSQEATLHRSRELLSSLREARIELGKGFLHLTLAGDPRSPFHREEGMAYLDQAIVSMKDAGGQLTIGSRDGKPHAELGESFQAKVIAFRQQLLEYAHAEPAARQNLELPLHLAFHDLENLSQQVDSVHQANLNSMASRLSVQFAGSLGCSVLLLGMMCLGVHQVAKRQQQTEAALRRSEAQLRTLVRTLPDLVWLKNPEGIYLACNARFESMFGALESEIIGKTDYDFMDRALADVFRANDAAAVAEGRARVNEEEVPFAADGHREHLETIKTPMFDENGKLIGVLGISRDISQRKKSEQALRTETERLTSILDAQREIASANLDYAGLLEFILESMSEMTGAEGASMEVAEGDEMVYLAATGFAGPFVGLRLKIATSLSGLCMKTCEIMRVDDSETDSRVDRAACRQIGLRSMFLLPLRYDESSIGVLKLMSPRIAAFLRGAEPTLRLMSEFLSATIARKQAEGALRRQTNELQARNEQLERFNRATVGRELRMIELKHEVNELCKAAGQPERYTTKTAAELAETRTGEIAIETGEGT
jgi:PAS domain S-box-containing protein